VTRYGLDGPAIESRWEATFSPPVQIGPGAYPAYYIMSNGKDRIQSRTGHGGPEGSRGIALLFR
jgi:hypothetical protein